MHDLDRTQLELADESLILEDESPDADFESFDADFEAPFTEDEEMQLAAELLEIQDEEQLDQFFGKLVRAARRGIGSLARSPLGHTLGGILKQVAKKALPVVGGAVGTMVAGPAGGLIGSKLASTAGRAFGLELEGLSPADQQLEVARRIVRLAGAASQQAAQPTDLPPAEAARTAVATAARQYAPGLVRPSYGTGRPGLPRPGSSYPAGRCSCSGRAAQGTWVRRGRYILLYGA